MANMKRASLKEIRQMKENGELYHNPNAPTGKSLGKDFWSKAKVTSHSNTKKSVHLKIDQDVFDFFKGQGKGHLTKMQQVLKEYIEYHSKKKA